MGITLQESYLESVFQKIARIIAQRFDIKVRIAGGRAFVNLETREITLPSISDETSKRLAPYLDGFLDHEVAHVLFTDPKVVDKGWNPTFHHLWNLVEDTFIERRMSAAYYGCARNLLALDAHIRKEALEAWDKLGPFQKICYALDAVMRFANESKDFYADPTIGEVMQLLAPEAEAGRHCSTSRQCADLAKVIYDKLAQVMEGKPVTVLVKAEGKPDPAEEAPSHASAAPGEDDTEGSEGEKSDGEDEEPGKPDDGEEEDSPAETGEGLIAVQVTPSKKAQEQAKAATQAALKGEEPKQDREGFVNEHITEFLERPTRDEPPAYVVFTEEYDEERYFTMEERLSYAPLYAKLLEESRQYVGNLSNIFEQLLLSRMDARWVGAELKGRRFDRQRMGRWLMGSSDERIFMRKEESERLDTAVSLLWDGSGSMGSSDSPKNKAALARIAAIAFHEALVRVQVPHEVLGFDTGGQDSQEVLRLAGEAKGRGEDLRRYSRVEERDNRYVFVPWGETDGRAICHLSGRAANRDAEAVLWATRRLAGRPERRKILIVGSDGQPSGARHHGLERSYLRDVVQRAISVGIEVYAIGIMDASVREYYPNWVVIQNAAELPRAVMTQLLASLTARGRENGIDLQRGVAAL